MKTTAILAGSLLALLVTTPVLAEDRGERINEHLDKRSDRLAANGHEKAAAHMDHKGDRIENRLDHRGDRVENKLDRRGGARRHGGVS